jgi:uncharacterized protein (TIGR02118 family)
MVVLYATPKDPAHFRSYYEATHLPLAEQLPGLRSHSHSFAIKGLGGPPPFFCIFEAIFDSAEAMGAALGSPEGKKVAADVANYATGAVTMMHYPIE